MSLLKRLVSRDAPDPALAGRDLTPSVTAAVAAAQAQPPKYVWQGLSDSDGVQLEAYPDVPRREVQPFFRQAPGRVLDIGCGTGATGEWLKQTYPGTWVWGCEPNPWTSARALDRLDRVTADPYEEWTSSELSLLPGVDTVLLLDVLEHMYNPWAQLKFLADHLRPDAQVIVSLPNVGHISVLASLAEGKFKYLKAGILDVTHIRFFTLAEMHDMFEQTGFKVEVQGYISSTASLHTLEEFPATVDCGKVILKVGSEQEWDLLNAIQFGFRLSPA